MLRKIIIIGIVSAIIGFLVFMIFQYSKEKSQFAKATAKLPAYRFYNLQGKPFTNDSLRPGQSIVFLYFNTGCGHCVYETEQIVKNEQQLRSTNLLMISRQPAQEIETFSSTYNLSSFPFITLLRDSAHSFYKTFGTTMVPSVFIYNRKNELVKKYLGETRIENIIHAAHE